MVPLYVGCTRYHKSNSINTLTWIVLHDEKEKTCLLINISIPDDSKVNTKESEKLRKYKDLEIEVSRMWKARTKIVPAIIGALGTIKKGLDQNLLLLPGHQSATELR